MVQKSAFGVWLKCLLIGAIALGILFRVINLDRKIYWVDETFTSLWLSGYSQEEVIAQVYDCPPVNISELQKYQQIGAEKSFADTISQLESQHPPLYYSLARLWNQQFGDSTTNTRRLSAAISILTIPFFYLLGRELFSSNTTGLVAAALFSVSPFHLLYAQEARQYSLWTMTIVLSSLCLLRAMRSPTQSAWGLYAASAALSLYASVNSTVLVVGYGIYSLIRESFRFNRVLLSSLAASSIGVVACVPWLIRLKEMEMNSVGWTGQDFGLFLLAGKWSANGVRLFFDVFSFDASTPIGQVLLLAPVGLAFVLLIIYAHYHLIRHAPREVWLFVLMLILPTFLFFALPDLIAGGRRSGVPRYVIPSFLGIQLAVAFLLSQKAIRLQCSKRVRFWRAALSGTVLSGILSCTIISQASVWWSKGDAYSRSIVEVSSIVNSTSNPLIVSDAKVIPILSLSHRINPSASILLVTQPELIASLIDFRNFNSVYLFQPSQRLKESLEQTITESEIKSLSSHRHSLLWQIVSTQ